jgi:hypothetical protein
MASVVVLERMDQDETNDHCMQQSGSLRFSTYLLKLTLVCEGNPLHWADWTLLCLSFAVSKLSFECVSALLDSFISF